MPNRFGAAATLLLAFTLPLAAQESQGGPATSSTPLEVNAEGFPVPSLEQFQQAGAMQTDATTAIEGDETTVEAFVAENDDRIFRLSSWRPSSESSADRGRWARATMRSTS
jgi:hypothetical protein